MPEHDLVHVQAHTCPCPSTQSRMFKRVLLHAPAHISCTATAHGRLSAQAPQLVLLCCWRGSPGTGAAVQAISAHQVGGAVVQQHGQAHTSASVSGASHARVHVAVLVPELGRRAVPPHRLAWCHRVGCPHASLMLLVIDVPVLQRAVRTRSIRTSHGHLASFVGGLCHCW